LLPHSLGALQGSPNALSGAQVPLPASQCVPSAQAASLAQLVGQEPSIPLHLNAPQLGEPAKPGGAGAHVPASVAHSSHAPSHAALQQTPSTQNPLAQEAQPGA
jgi:hypothetical protein